MQVYNTTDFIADIKQIIEQARKQLYSSINIVMIQSHWFVGKRIVEEGKVVLYVPNMAKHYLRILQQN